MLKEEEKQTSSERMSLGETRTVEFDKGYEEIHITAHTEGFVVLDTGVYVDLTVKEAKELAQQLLNAANAIEFYWKKDKK